MACGDPVTTPLFVKIFNNYPSFKLSSGFHTFTSWLLPCSSHATILFIGRMDFFVRILGKLLLCGITRWKLFFEITGTDSKDREK